MEEKISLKDFQQQWEKLIRNEDAIATSTTRKRKQTPAEKEDQEDPFDCSSICIPPNATILDILADKFSEEWKELDERRIAVSASTEDSVCFPQNFDYATRLPAGPPPEDPNGDRIISLDDPTKQTSYHSALWDLFASIPTAEQVEAAATVGHHLPRTQAICDEITAQTKDYARLDAHALARMRLSDRHGLPPILSPSRNGQASPNVTTLTLECWRGLPRRGYTADPNRAVFEFLGSHTLLDVHNAIEELMDDQLWLRSLPGQPEQRQGDGSTGPGSDEATAENRDVDSSGFFFIEGVFYTTGTVDYVTPIQTWLQKGTKSVKRKRAILLGIDPDENKDDRPIRSMASTRLEDLALRLGVRYTHVHHGDVELCVYVTDRSLVPAQESRRYPIVHDVWNHGSITFPDCDACQYRVAVLISSPKSFIGQRCLCQACFQQLGLPGKEVDHFLVWKAQPDLSSGTKITSQISAYR